MRLASQGEIAERRFLETLYGPLLLLLLLQLNTTGKSQQEEEERWESNGFDVKRGFSSSLEAPFGPFVKTSYSFLTSSFNSKPPFLDISGIEKPRTMQSVLMFFFCDAVSWSALSLSKFFSIFWIIEKKEKKE